MALAPDQSLPSGDTAGDQFARELALLIGPAYQPGDGSIFAEDLGTIGDSLGDAYATQSRALDQAFPQSATDLLPDWEFRLQLPIDTATSVADRQAAIVAKRRALGGASKLRLLSAVQAIEPAAQLIPNRAIDVQQYPRAVFQWALLVPAATWADAKKRARITAVIEQSKPAHTRSNVATRIGFRCNDPNSLVNRDLLKF